MALKKYYKVINEVPPQVEHERYDTSDIPKYYNEKEWFDKNCKEDMEKLFDKMSERRIPLIMVIQSMGDENGRRSTMQYSNFPGKRTPKEFILARRILEAGTDNDEVARLIASFLWLGIERAKPELKANPTVKKIKKLAEFLVTRVEDEDDDYFIPEPKFTEEPADEE